MKHRIIIACLGALAICSSLSAQEMLAPPSVDGEAVYIPFPVTISLDGELDDWAGVPSVTVERGPMTSSDPLENGSFTFAAAADEEFFYVTMSMVDQNIITGQHGDSYWNEDSLEFYLNLSGERLRTEYGDGVFQFNINPGHIGNTDPSEITITGTSSASAEVQAIVFETDDGWGFEATVSIADYVTPEHGLEIGFQAQANGASSADRDVKLIWSLADTDDTSWQNPSVFGSGIFFEVGRTDIPEVIQPVAAQPTETPQLIVQVSVNQVGYFPDSVKFAMVTGTGTSDWSLINVDTNETVAEGTTSEGVLDNASGDTVQTIDFSDFSTPGTYRLVVGDAQSVPFQIGSALYSQLKQNALHYFYLNRSGIPLEPEYAGEWAREAGHISDEDVTCWEGTDADGQTWDGCDYRLNVRGGWYDAGDYGKYVVNGGISVWTLLNLYERLPDSFGDGTLSIPESGNGVPDILDEARWEMEFLLAMQVPGGQPLAGMVHHKMHDRRWSGVPVMPPAEVDNDNQQNGRFLFPPSTAATLNMAATAAQCARIWREIDPEFANRCLNAAQTAWNAANENPVMLAGRTPGEGGGDYGDGNVDDEFYWAAAELFITTGDEEYREYLTASRYFNVFPGTNPSNVSSMSWGGTAALGTISLAVVPNTLPENDIEVLRNQITEAAEGYLETIGAEGYRVPISDNRYYWGSNSDVLNNAIILALAYDFTSDDRFLNGVNDSMDYVLGRNALGFSFVSGYGAVSMQHPHHRFWGNRPQSSFPPPPPGALAGGPNAQPADPAAINAVGQFPPAKRYIDDIESYSTNEVTINWNAPLVWVSAYLDARFNER
uniref:Cellulase n=1 Tax=uncultured organism TaxID=155900 RepID=H9TUL5_9ZZZZ|nr:cellulase [uncultured organism]